MAIGTAHATSLKEDESFTSIDLQINFFRPVWNGRIRALRGCLLSLLPDCAFVHLLLRY
jgi:hypothetical protein